MKRVLLIVACLALAACTDPEGAKTTLAAQGYTNIETTGYKAFFGGKEDVYVTGFVATSPNGTRVSGAICKGAFKGSTIRFE